jgi:thiamine-monophosphate kinase
MNADDNDDCAVYDFPGNLSLVIGMDFVRGPGFVLFQEHYLNYFDLGYYLVVANLSDIAAMGATPIGITTVIRYHESLTDEDFSQILQGIKAAAALYQTPIVGGDIGGYTETVLAATAFGITQHGKYLKRRGALPGDLLCLTGEIGLASTALVYFTKARKLGFLLAEEEEAILLRAWRRPVARIREGLVLTQLGVVHVCQDVSDGVKATIDQLAQASSVSFKIDEASLPIHPLTRKVATMLDVDPISVALSASVDFELMFTISPADLINVQRVFLLPGTALHVLGEAIPSSIPSYLLRNDGGKSSVPGVAWDQQVQNVADVILE